MLRTSFESSFSLEFPFWSAMADRREFAFLKCDHAMQRICRDGKGLVKL